MDPAQTAALQAELIQGGFQIRAAKAIVLSGLIILYYDYLLTLQDEIRFVWQAPKSLVSRILFFVRFYPTSPRWHPMNDLPESILCTGGLLHVYALCEHAARFLPIGLTLTLFASSSILLTLRVYALYERNKYLLAFLSTYMIAEFAVGLWIFVSPQPGPFLGLPLPTRGEFYFCAPENPSQLDGASAAYNTMETVFEFIIFFLVVMRSLYMRRDRLGMSSIVKILLADGAIYFLFIGSVQLTWTLMLYTAPRSLQNVVSGLAVATVAVMINRITMNLRAHIRPDEDSVPLSTLKFKEVSRGTTTGTGTEGEIDLNQDLELGELGRSTTAGHAHSPTSGDGPEPQRTHS